MWNASKITIGILISITLLLTKCLYDKNVKYDKLNELAAFSCTNHHFLSNNLKKGEIELAKKTLNDTLSTIRSIRKEQRFKGKYWDDFDYYVEGMSK